MRPINLDIIPLSLSTDAKYVSLRSRGFINDVSCESQSQNQIPNQSDGPDEDPLAPPIGYRGNGGGGCGRGRGRPRGYRRRTIPLTQNYSSEEPPEVEGENESIQNEAPVKEERSREDTGMDRTTLSNRHTASTTNRAIDELLEKARALTRNGKRWCSNQFFYRYVCRYCEKELGIDELEADIHIIEHLSDPEDISSIQQFKQVLLIFQ